MRAKLQQSEAGGNGSEGRGEDGSRASRYTEAGGSAVRSRRGRSARAAGSEGSVTIGSASNGRREFSIEEVLATSLADCTGELLVGGVLEESSVETVVAGRAEGSLVTGERSERLLLGVRAGQQTLKGAESKRLHGGVLQGVERFHETVLTAVAVLQASSLSQVRVVVDEVVHESGNVASVVGLEIRAAALQQRLISGHELAAGAGCFAASANATAQVLV